MKELYIHIGTHKTGSTAIQNTLRLLNSELQKEGVEYIEIGNWQHIRNLMLIDHYSEELTNKLADFLIKKTTDSKANKFVISYEGLSGNLGTFYQNLPVVMEVLSKATVNYSTYIIAFLRRQDDFIQSVFMQKNHEGQNINIEDILKVNDNFLYYSNYISDVNRFFDAEKCFFFPYDRIIFQSYDIIQIFNIALKSSILDRYKSNAENVGFSESAKKIFNELKDSLNSDEQFKLRRLLQKYSNKGVFNEYNILSYQEKKECLSVFRKDNQTIASKYWFDAFNIKDFSEIQQGHIDESDETTYIKQILVQLIKDNYQKIKPVIQVNEPSLSEMISILKRKVLRKIIRK